MPYYNPTTASPLSSIHPDSKGNNLVDIANGERFKKSDLQNRENPPLTLKRPGPDSPEPDIDHPADS